MSARDDLDSARGVFGNVLASMLVWVLLLAAMLGGCSAPTPSESVEARVTALEDAVLAMQDVQREQLKRELGREVDRLTMFDDAPACSPDECRDRTASQPFFGHLSNDVATVGTGITRDFAIDSEVGR